MPIRPEQTRHVAEAARRRHAASLLVGAAGAALAYGSALALLLVTAARALPILRLDERWPSVMVVPVLLSAAVFILLSLTRSWSRFRAAREVDRRLALRDRLSTALELSERPIPGVEPAIVELAVQDAERVARHADPARAVPIRWGRSWIVGAALLLLTLAVGLWMPHLDLVARQARAREHARHAEHVRRAIAEARSIAQAAAAEEAPVLDASSTPELQAIQEIERQLAAGLAGPDQARAETARQLQALAERLESTARREQSQDRSLREILSRSMPTARDPDEATDLARALREGDLASAARAAEELSSHLDRLPPDQRRRIAEELLQISEALDAQRLAHADAPAPNEPASPDSPGLVEPSPPRPEPPPRDEPSTDRSDAGPPASDDLRRLRDALRDAARAIEQAQPPHADRSPAADRHAGATPPRVEPQPSGDPQPGDQPPSDPGHPRPDASRPGGRPETPRQDQPTDPGQTTQRGDQRQPAQPSDQQGRTGEPRPAGDPRPSGEPSTGPQSPGQGQPTPQPAPRPAPGGQPQPTPAPGERPDQPAPPGLAPADQPRTPPGQTPSDTSPRPVPGDKTDVSPRPDQPDARRSPVIDTPPIDPVTGQPMPQPRDASEPGQGPDTPDEKAIERLAQQLRRLEQMDESARRRLAESRTLREQAERLLRQMSPAERQRLEDLARRWGGDPSAPGSDRPDQAPAPEWTGPIQTVDARPRGEPARGVREAVISEWLTPATPDPDAVARRQAVAERFREAARGVERAVEQQAVPLQHRDLVRRVFNRYTERAAGSREPR